MFATASSSADTCQQRPIKRDPEKRPRKETQKRDPEKRPRKETQKRDPEKSPRLLLYDNFTYLHRIFATASSSPQSEKKPIKETHKTDP